MNVDKLSVVAAKIVVRGWVRRGDCLLQKKMDKKEVKMEEGRVLGYKLNITNG
jgi:hypothetical protein